MTMTRIFSIRRRSPYPSDAGVALTEFALVLPLLLLLLFGMLDLGKALNFWIDETHLSSEGARWAVVNKNPGPGPTLAESIRLQADTPELRDGGTASVPDSLSVCISFPNGTANVGDPVNVTVSTTYNWLPFLGEKLGVVESTLSSSATMRIEQAPTNYSAGCA